MDANSTNTNQKMKPTKDTFYTRKGSSLRMQTDALLTGQTNFSMERFEEYQGDTTPQSVTKSFQRQCQNAVEDTLHRDMMLAANKNDDKRKAERKPASRRYSPIRE